MLRGPKPVKQFSSAQAARKQGEHWRFVAVATGIGRRERVTSAEASLYGKKGCSMSLGVSIFLLVVGAILTFAVNVNASGFNINVVGVILMAAGALGVLLSMIFWSSYSPWTRRRRPMIDTVYDDRPDRVIEERRVERDLP
jgi:type IV secretory pathway VirB3-like protein